MLAGQKLTFGRHKGKTLLSVLSCDPSYALWAHRHIPTFALTKGQIALARRQVRRERMRIVAQLSSPPPLHADGISSNLPLLGLLMQTAP